MDIIRKNKVLSNIASLSFTKGIDIFIPLLLVPFLVNNLGVDKYGVFVTCLVTLNFLMRFTDFGINVNSSIKIAGNNKIKHVLHILIVSTQAKILLLVPALIFFYLLSISFGLEYFYASLLLSIALVCDTLSPFSFYQGLQQLKCYAFTCLAWRVISAVLTLFLVKSNEDFLLYCLLYSLPYAGILLSLYAPIIKKNHEDIVLQWDVYKIKETLQEGKRIYSFGFISGLFIPVLTNFIAITNVASVVTVFNVSQRIFSSAYRFFEPINTSLFPYLSNLYTKNKTEYIRRSRVAFILFFTGSLFSLLILCSLYKLIINTFMGGGSDNVETVLIYILCGLSLIANVMNLYTTHLLIIIGKAFYINRIVLVGLILLLASLAIVYTLNLSVVYSVAVGNIPAFLTFLLSWKTYHSEINKQKSPNAFNKKPI